MAQKLVFIYNADSGLRNAILDSAHKIFSPGTYECSLCDITYGAFKEKQAWRTYRTQTAIAMEFLHRDEFLKIYKSKFGYKFSFPIVLIETNNGLEILVKTEELNKMKRPEDLIKLIQERTTN